MKQQVSPAIAVVAIVLVVVVAAFAWVRFTGSGAGSKEGEKPPGMPADAAAEFQRRMGSSMPTGTDIPKRAGGGPGTGYLAPPGAK